MSDEDEPKALPGPGIDRREGQPAAAKGGVSGLVLFFALLLAVAGVAGSAYNYYLMTLQEMDQVVSLDQQVSEAAARNDAEIARLERSLENIPRYDTQIGEIEKALDDLSVRVQELGSGLENVTARIEEIAEALSGLAETQERNTESLKTLFERQGQNQTDWTIAEVEHLMVIAVQRLNLQHDVDTALAALQAADERLASLGEPGLYDTRRRLAADMNALRSVDLPDITGISLYLADMAARAGELPLKASPLGEANREDNPLPADTPAWRRLAFNVWQELKGMFVITRTGGNGEATLLPDEKYFLYLNLRLQLETARLAVLRRDTGNLRESMQLIQTWLNEYFDTTDNGVANMIQAAERMAEIELNPELPDISSSLESLRAFMRERNAGGNPARGTGAR